MRLDTNGETALPAGDKQRPDLILMDIQSPVVQVSFLRRVASS